ncbi:MAG: SDR family oxidoreductase [Candidatus Shapirobacteria bacterium]
MEDKIGLILNKQLILTTGLTGLIGSRINELLSPDYNFINFPHRPQLGIENKEKVFSFLSKYPQAKTVLHLAAFTDVQSAWKENGDKRGKCYQINVLGTKNIAQACKNLRKHLIYFSTDYIFDGQKSGAHTEKDQPKPIDWYGRTKYLGEVAILKSSASSTILRIAYPFRSSFKGKKDVVRKIIEALEKESLHPMFCDQITTPTLIDDIALALPKIIRKKPIGVYHFVGSSFQSPYKMAKIIAKIFGFKPHLVKKGSLAEYRKKQTSGSFPWHQNLALSNKKIKTALKLQIRTLEESILEVKNQLS